MLLLVLVLGGLALLSISEALYLATQVRKLRNRPIPPAEVTLPFPVTDNRAVQEVTALSRQLERDVHRVEETLARMPGKVLDSITNSANSNKGKLGELIAYLGIRASYDRIVPISDIVDFMAVTLPREATPGEIVFIEVKSGESARLRKDQTAFRRLIQEKRVRFIELRIEADAPPAQAENNNS